MLWATGSIAQVIVALVCRQAGFNFSASLAVTGLVRRVRSSGEAQREQAQLLDLTTDAVFIRNEHDVIIYWTVAQSSFSDGTGMKRSARYPMNFCKQSALRL